MKELKSLRKMHHSPGKIRAVKFMIPAEQLAFYNQSMKRVVEPETFTIFVGSNSANTMEAPFEVVQ